MALWWNSQPPEVEWNFNRVLPHPVDVPALERTHVQRETLSVAPPSVPGAPAPLVFLSDHEFSAEPELQSSDVAGLRSRGVLAETASLSRRMARVDDSEAESQFRPPAFADGLMMTASLIGTHPRVVGRGIASLLQQDRHGGHQTADLIVALGLGDWMRSHRVAQIYATLGERAAEVALLTSQAWSVPYSLSTRGSDAWLRLPDARLHPLVAAAAAVICDSQHCRSQLMLKLRPALWSKLRVVRPGVDPAALTPAPPRQAEDGRPIDIVCVAPLIASKGQRILIEAMAVLLERGVAFTVTLLGDGPERRALTSLAKDRGVAGRLLFSSLPTQAAIRSRVREADLFVLPSLGDTVPLPLLDAMALGLPCISTTVGAIPELIQSGRDGILIAPSSVQALAEAITTLAGDATLRQFLGRSARRRVVCDFNLPLNQEQLVQHLQSVA